MKGERPDFVVLTVIDEELEAVKKVFEERSGKEFKKSTDSNHPVSAAFWELEIGGQKVFLVKPADKGNETAASLTRGILDYWNPRYLLLVGIGGGVKDVGRLCGEKRRESGLKIGDVVFSKFIHYYDYRNVEWGEEVERTLTIGPPSVNLRIIAQSISLDWEHDGSRAHEGVILTGNAVINDPDYARKIVYPQFKRERFLVFETEAGGVARAVYDLINEKKPSFLVIRAISDFVDDPEGGEKRKNNRKRAAEAAAAFAYELIRTIAESELEKRRENLQPYLDEAKRLFEGKNPVDGKALNEYYIQPNALIVDKDTWDKKEEEIKSGREWDVQEFLENDNQWYVVIGAPFGTGKTTYVKHLAYMLANEFDRYKYVPIFIRLKEWTEEEVKNNAVAASNGELISTVLSQVIQSDATPLLILDGLDEFSGGARSIYNWITSLYKDYQEMKVVITTRLKAGIPEDLHFKKYVRLLGFRDDQIEEFFKKYGFDDIDLSKVRDFGLSDEDLRKPLFCWMIGNASSQLENFDRLFLEGESENKKTAFFYYVLTHLLLKGKHIHMANKEDYPLYRKEKEFLRLAAAFMNLKNYLKEPITYDELVNWVKTLDADLNLDIDMHDKDSKNKLIEPFLTSYFYLHQTIKGKTIEFIHQSFQDYFLAEYYYENIREGRVEMLNVGIPNEATINFLKGLVEVSSDSNALKKLREISKFLPDFFDFERQSRNAKEIVENENIVIPSIRNEVRTRKRLWIEIPLQSDIFKTLWIHRWIALASLKDEVKRRSLPKRILETLIRYSSFITPYWLKKLEYCNINGINLTKSELSKANLTMAVLSEADLSEIKLTGSILTGTDLSKARLFRTELDWADLAWANLSEAELETATLHGAHLRGAILQNADVSGADLTEAILCEADLTKADLTWTSLIRADLSGANLTEADLSEADLYEADISGVNFNRTNITGANFTEVKWKIPLRGLETVILGETPEEILDTLLNMDEKFRDLLLKENAEARKVWESYMNPGSQ